MRKTLKRQEKYCRKLHANKLEHSNEMQKFIPEKSNVIKLTQEEIEYHTSRIQIISTKKTQIVT